MFKKINKGLSLIVAVCVLFSTVLLQASTLQADNQIQSDELKRQEIVFTDQLNETNSVVGKNSTVTISSIAKAKDFAGNAYLIVEGNPEGYLIYNVNTGRTCEKSPFGKSPFYGKKQNLFYAGITYYYQKRGNKYYNLEDESEVLSESDIEKNKLDDDCKKIQDYYNESPKTAVLNYVNTGNKSAYTRTKKEINAQLQATLKAKRNNSNSYFSFYDFFYNLDDCGYIDGGKCGFIALAMIYAAWDAAGYDNFVEDRHFTDSSKTGLKGSLATEMYNLSPKSSTTANHINKVSNLYASKHNLSIHYEWYYAPVASYGKVAGIINQTGNPVIIFGNLTGVGNHAVVGYYTPPDKEYIACHKGWPNETYVLWDGPIGSYYYMHPNN